MISGRNFTASLKPAWNMIKINDFLIKMKGSARVFIINHDKDTNENGELIEEHTHILIEYKTPRKISTVANLLECETNFVEVVKNKTAVLRYLTHMDDVDKYQYDHENVYHNTVESYSALIQGSLMSDKEIAEYIAKGKGMELLGVVSATKLRTIQSFMHFDTSNAMLKEQRKTNQLLRDVKRDVLEISTMAKSFIDDVETLSMTAAQALTAIALSLETAVKSIK